MKIKVKYNSIIPRLLKSDGVTLYPFVFFRGSEAEVKNTPELFKHEMIHVEQVERLGWIRFYGEYLFRQIFGGYRANRFEKEAY